MKRGLLSILLTASAFLANSQVVLNIESPASIAGNYSITYADPAGGWGVPDPLDPLNAVTGSLELVDDGTAADSLGCNALINDLTGDIAVVYRGDCEFGTKAFNAQNAGAIAVIIINNVTGDPVGMAPGADGANVTIPLIMISQIDGSLIRARLDAGDNVIAFIGNKSGLFDNDLGMREARTLLPNPNTNYTLLAQNDSEYQFRVGGWLYNDGKLDQVNTTFTAEITYGGSVIYTQSEPNLTIPAQDSMYVEFTIFTAANYPSGKYTLTYNVDPGVVDQYPSDNDMSIDFNVSNDLFSYVKLNTDGLPNSTTAYRTSAATSTFSSCIHFRDPNASRVKALGLYFAATTNTSAELLGQEFTINAFKWNNSFTDINDPNAAIDDLEEMTNGTYTYIEDSLDFMTVFAPFATPFVLENDQRYLFCVTTYDPNTYIGYGDLDYSWVLDTVLQPLFPIQTDAGFNIVGFGGESSAIGIKMSQSGGAPVISVSGPTTICQGESVTLTSTIESGNVWSTGEGTRSIVVSQPGTYTVSVGGLTSTSVTVVVNSYPATPTISAPSTVVCPGSNVTLTSSATANSWSTGETTNQIVVTAAGNYTVQADNNGCLSAPATIKVTDFAIPTITTVGATTFCEGGNVALISSYANGNSWSTGETGQAIVVTTTQNISLTVTAMGCTSPAGTSVSTVMNPAPVVGTASLVAPTTCGGTDATIDLTGSGTLDIEVFGPVPSTLTGVTLPTTLSTLSAGSYVVSSTNAAGCNSTTLFTIDDPGAPAAPSISSTGTTFCAGSSLDLTASVGTDILWSTGETTQTITVTAAGNYSVQTGMLGGCVSSSPVTKITVNAIPTVSAGTDMAVCAGGSVTLMGDGAATYTWDNGVTNGVSFAPSATTTYIVTGTDLNGCTNTDDVMVTVNALPTVTAGADQTTCVGTMVTVSGSGASTYVWDNGVADGVAFVAFTTQDYTVTGTDANGCTGTDIMSLTVNQLPNVTYAEATDSMCWYNPAVTLSAGSPALGVYSGTGVIVGASGATFDPTGLPYPSFYSIVYTATDINGCQASASQAIFVGACASLEELDAYNIEVYPNPATSEFTISSDKLMNFQTIELTDQLGRVIQTWNVNKTFMSLNVSQIANGNYNLVFKGIDGKAVERVQVSH